MSISTPSVWLELSSFGPCRFPQVLFPGPGKESGKRRGLSRPHGAHGPLLLKSQAALSSLQMLGTHSAGGRAGVRPPHPIGADTEVQKGDVPGPESHGQ